MNFFSRLTLGSKILFSLLLTALLSILLAGYLGYSGGRSGLTDAVFNQLISLRNVKAQEISEHFNLYQNYVLTLSENSMVIDSINAFKGAVEKLEGEQLATEQRLRLVDYYEKNFIPRLAKNIQGKPRLQTYLPSQPAQQYLQYHYIAANPNPVGERGKLDFAKDGSEYSAIHKKYHYRFRNILERMGFEDLYLIDADTGQVLYTVDKKVDFITNLETGPFFRSNLAQAFSKSTGSRDAYYVSLIDFDFYRPSFGQPSAFITTTVFDGNKLIGVLVLQLSDKRLNELMNFGKQWQESGLGKTGEMYLVGDDLLLRTSPRLFLENPDAYFQALAAANFDRDKIERIRNGNSPILIQEVDTEGVRNALRGQSGTSSYKNYLGVPVLSAYEPVRFGDFRWAVVVTMDQSEAFRPVQNLTRRLIVITAILIPLFTLLALGFARLLARPINSLIAATKRIAAGEKDVRVEFESRDEIGQLARTFNGMASSLDEKDRIIEQKIQEYNRLLLNILPEPIAKRLQSGEQDIADSFPSVTVVYAEFEEFTEVSVDISAGRRMALINELIGAFDETAERFGIEKLKTIGSSYIAVCGLTIPRIDHPKRAVDFSFALLKLMEAFNKKEGCSLGLDIGIHSGPVVAGIVGKTKFIYELWGETMNIARDIHISPGQKNLIHVSESVYSALEGLYDFQRMDDMMVRGKGYVPVWSVHPLHSCAKTVAGEGTGT